MRIDSHQHFWQYDPQQYGWITDRMAVLRRDYLPADLEPHLRALDFDGSIAVQARQSLEETEWLLQLADGHPRIKGVVGWVDLVSAELRPQLERFSAHPKLVGVRHVLQDESNDEFMLRPDFCRGLSRLREFELTYDLLIYPKHLPLAVQLVEQFPDQPFVLDHLGKPVIWDHQVLVWREDLRRLSECPNVFCKLSGLVTEAKWRQWRPEDFTPYLEAAFECFGPDRLMIGSDWPVCLLSGEYVPTLCVVLGFLEQFSPEVRAGILGGNCARFYGLS